MGPIGFTIRGTQTSLSFVCKFLAIISSSTWSSSSKRSIIDCIMRLPAKFCGGSWPGEGPFGVICSSVRGRGDDVTVLVNFGPFGVISGESPKISTVASSVVVISRPWTCLSSDSTVPPVVVSSSFLGEASLLIRTLLTSFSSLLSESFLSRVYLFLVAASSVISACKA